MGNPRIPKIDNIQDIQFKNRASNESSGLFVVNPDLVDKEGFTPLVAIQRQNGPFIGLCMGLISLLSSSRRPGIN
jgi:hypothetical protein